MHCCCTKSGDILQVALELLLISSMWLNVCTGKWPTTTWPHKLTILWNSTLYWHCTTFYHTLRSKNCMKSNLNYRISKILWNSTLYWHCTTFYYTQWGQKIYEIKLKQDSLIACQNFAILISIYVWILQVSTIWNLLSSRVYVTVLLLYDNIFGGNEWVFADLHCIF